LGAVVIWLLYYLIKYVTREKNSGKKEPEQEIPEGKNMSSSL
jgi:hypothetical protein